MIFLGDLSICFHFLHHCTAFDPVIVITICQLFKPFQFSLSHITNQLLFPTFLLPEDISSFLSRGDPYGGTHLSLLFSVCSNFSSRNFDFISHFTFIGSVSVPYVRRLFAPGTCTLFKGNPFPVNAGGYL